MARPTDAAVSETENELIAKAQRAVSGCNWEVGECAAKWTRKYAKGRTDADFAAMVGLSGDQVYQRRRVWEAFGDKCGDYPALKWSHFYVALNWADAPECLEWAEENEATVAEMRAWRRAVRGEDLAEDVSDDSSFDEWGSPVGISYLPGDLTPVRDQAHPPPVIAERATTANVQDRAPATVRGMKSRLEPLRENPNRGASRMPRSVPAREVPAPENGGDDVAVLERPQPSAEQLCRRMSATLERMNKALTPRIIKEISRLPETQRSRFLNAVSDLTAKAAELR